MSKRKCLIGCLLALGLVSTAAPTADAIMVFHFPLFWPIAECGTVTIVDQTIPFPNGDPEGGCLAWKADSGGTYLVGGLEAFSPGDRVFVDGDICNTCLTTCAAGAILNSELSPCDGGGDK